MSVFATVGSQRFPFDRLLRALDACVADGSIPDGVFAQTGASGYVPGSFPSEPFLDRTEYARRMAGADVVVTHGGTGAIVGALKRGKRVVAMARLARLGEHVDDHQLEVVGAFREAGLVCVCEDAASLAAAYREALSRPPASFRSTNAEFVEDLDVYLQSIDRHGKGERG